MGGLRSTTSESSAASDPKQVAPGSLTSREDAVTIELDLVSPPAALGWCVYEGGELRNETIRKHHDGNSTL